MPNTPKIPNKANGANDDPVRALAEILKDEKFTAEDKQLLFDMARTRFKNRRIMAYISLFGILGFALLSAIPNFDIDQINWVYATLAGIVATYYGMSAFRPSS